MPRASAEAELIALDYAAVETEVIMRIARELKMTDHPAVILQDNEATMKLANAGHALSRKTKHIKVRYFSIKQRIDDKILSLAYQASGDLTADALTKPLARELFLIGRDRLMTCVVPAGFRATPQEALRLFTFIGDTITHVTNDDQDTEETDDW